MSCDNPLKTGGGPNIESEGANPVKEKGSPDRAEGDMRLLQDDDETDEENKSGEETKDGEDDGDDAADGEDGDEEEEEESEIPECKDGEMTITKAPSGFGDYAKV